MRVVFDTNVFQKLINHDKDNCLTKIEKCIAKGEIIPFLCESQFVEELLPKKEREKMRIGNPKLYTSERKENGVKIFTMKLKVGSKNPTFAENVVIKEELDLAISQGFRLLHSPLYICGISNPDLKEYRKYFLKEEEIGLSWELVNENKLEAMNIIDDRLGSIKTNIRIPKFQNKQASSDDEEIDFAEVSDRYIISAAYGHNIRFVCSLDEASSKTRGGTYKEKRVFHLSHRKFLQDELNIHIIKPEKLWSILSNPKEVI
jgi:hypothetical protein